MSTSPPTHPCPSCHRPVETGARFCPHCGEKVPLRSVPANEDPFIGRMVSQRYRVETRIASGGMGEVYRARHVELQQTVAVKFLHRRFADDEELAARFFNEARTAVKVKHPQAVSIYDFGRLDDGTLYLVMEFVEGEPLAERLRRDGPMPEEATVSIALQVAEVLQRAHDHSVVHRDVKPDNIMLVDGGVGRHSIKVLDFGIAKILDDDLHGGLTQTGMMFGTPEYMAPEQAAGDPVDHRVDLYALGLVLYAMLTGHPPFEGQNKLALLQRQIHETPTPVKRAAPHPVSEPLADLVGRLLAKDPGARPGTASALHDELSAIASGTARVVAKRGAAPEVDDDPDREPEQLELTMSATLSGGFQLGDAPASSTAEFDLGLDGPVTASERFELGAGGGDDDAWSFGEDPLDGHGTHLRRQPNGPPRAVLAIAALVGLALLAGVVVLVSGGVDRATSTSDPASETDAQAMVDGAEEADGSGEEIAAAVPAAHPSAAEPGEGSADATERAAAVAGDEDAAAANTPTPAPATDEPETDPTPAETAANAAQAQADAGLARLRAGSVADAREALAALSNDGATGDAVDALRAGVAQVDAWDAEVRELLAAGSCHGADAVVIEMREAWGTRLAARWYGDLDACRATARGGASSGGSSTGSSTTSSAGATPPPAEPPPRRGPPPTL